ncbi:MAG: 3-hydroxyacyl-ACP dehydratase FabZ family protein [Planctomycetota bacterium]|nr:3-hydroxyacyl-ACP dehydratase FabZ family protein [Planctomycetota bacterium]
MKFYLVDGIKSLEPGKRIVTSKALSLAEEYLADHFPAFPVMPGVLMLEALTQSAAWLLRVQQDFSRSIIVLSSVRNVRYGSFVQPGDVLRCEVEAVEIGRESSKFKGVGFVGEKQTVTARLQLRSFNLAEKASHLAAADQAIVAQLKQRFKLIGGPEALAKK